MLAFKVAGLALRVLHSSFAALYVTICHCQVVILIYKLFKNVLVAWSLEMFGKILGESAIR